MPPVAIWIALLSSLLYALASTTLRTAMRTATPMASALLIAVIQWVLYSILVLTTGKLYAINAPGLAWFLVAGLLAPGLFTAFFYIGVKRIGASRASTIKSAAPVYAVIGAIIFLGERPSVFQYFGIGAVIAGLLTIASEGDNRTPPKTNPPDPGQDSDESPRAPAKGGRGRKFDLIFPLLAGVCAGIAAILYKVGLARLDSPLLGAWIGSTIALLILPGIALLFPKPDRYRIGPPRAWMWVSLGALAIAGAIYCRILSVGLGDVSIVFTLVQTSPLFVILISAVFLRELERVTRQVVFGAVLTVAGAIVVSVF